jgi:AraC-like DNA-binding protein
MRKVGGGNRNSFWHYLPYSTEDEKIGMVCTTAGSNEIGPHTEYPPQKNKHPAIFRLVAEGRVLPEFQIVYITRGQGCLTAKGISYTVKPGSMFLILPGMKHRYKPVFETGWHEYWVGFKGVFFATLLQEGILSQDHIFFDIGLHDNIMTIFNTILDEARAQRPLYQLKACSGVLSLIAEMLTHERREEQPNYYQNIVEKAKCLMGANVYSEVNLTSISEQIGISASRLNEVFKTYTAMTPYQYYIHIKIHKAEGLLEQDMPVKEVSYRLGFEDQYYFSRLFKNKTGISPSRWKKFVFQQG